MAAQAQIVCETPPSKLNWKDILITLLMLIVGGIVLVMGGFGTQASDQATFTDQMLGNLFTELSTAKEKGTQILTSPNAIFL